MFFGEIWILILASTVVLAAVLGIFLAINPWPIRKERERWNS